ncbi:MAG: hypothetical protein ABI685_04950 [Ferruginibacter sp.]
MSVNLLEKLQQHLGYPEIQKIDPNTQQVVGTEDKFSQAAIPAVLTGLYRFVQTDEGAEEILLVKSTDLWISKIFDADRHAVLQVVSDYSNQTDNTEEKMNAIANEAVKLVKENLAEGAGIKEVKLFFKDQKNNILLHLPPALNLGKLLQDETLDDNTNKMEGPVSSLMQSIGNAFSSPVTAEEVKKS